MTVRTDSGDHLDLLRSASSIETDGSFAFVHAGIDPAKPVDAQIGRTASRSGKASSTIPGCCGPWRVGQSSRRSWTLSRRHGQSSRCPPHMAARSLRRVARSGVHPAATSPGRSFGTLPAGRIVTALDHLLEPMGQRAHDQCEHQTDCRSDRVRGR
jgi:hypothetical protein